MKKILSLLLCLALLAGLFAVSAAAEEASAEPAEAPEAAVDFTEVVGPQAFAATMAFWLGGYEEGAALEDPLFVWDAAGWYAAWLYRTEGCDLLSKEELGDFLRSLGGEDSPLPAGWEEYGVLRVLRSRDGSESYDFVQHKLEIDEMLGVNTMVSFVESRDNTLTTVLSCFYEEGLHAEWMYDLRFEEAEGEPFPYRLTGLAVLDDGPQLDPALNFSWDEVLEANLLENVLAHYPAVRISMQTSLEPEPESDLSGTWLFMSGGALARVSYGETYTGGEYRGCFFEVEEAEDGAERARIGQIEDGLTDYLNSYIADFLDGVVIVELEEEEDDLIWLGCTYRGGYRERVALDRGTLVLRALDYSMGDLVPPCLTVFDYMKPAPDYPFLESWDGELRTVTAVWEDFRQDEETGEWQQVVETVYHRIPADWEYVPYDARWGDYTIYMNLDYTKPYEYPGDGVDYTLYLTTAKG